MQTSTRNIIFQSLKLVFWAIMAIALVKVAFFPNQEVAEELSPQGVFELPTVTAELGDIENSIELNATVVRDQSKAFKSTESGVVQTIFVKDGDTVEAGAPVLQLMKVTVKEVPGQSSVDEEGNVIPGASEQVEQKSWHDVYAPASGILRLEALVGQQVEVGSPLGSIVPASFHAQVSINPEQLYSLQGLPNVATLAVKDGPAPFECTDLQTIVNASAPKEGEQSSGPQIRCNIPAGQTVFEGVKGKLRIAGSSVKQVVIVPTSAVEGRFREGAVYLPAEDGKSKPIKKVVKLGISDGKFIEITEGLQADDVILEFAPLNQDEKQDINGPENYGG
ncbi:efflux RND transporter periplasmic adaptor subunit [Gleimia sp. 6138-11-ORH1]|uniref:efflux RND transporter periplasmic adaptor subunit n=1 Tax=Gleimia sp. 6138-11-ORH1 TaxID=2973937 RepID=UPI0021685F64|nr:efflux RND transporter periplasmic adaptor subunit [Gleimia sp. 6138-11-ORH1]MCS4485051.1 efflux RND transporter periplasmic adaptor subunit [Gleimia sp. 6138-11-ORH1]